MLLLLVIGEAQAATVMTDGPTKIPRRPVGLGREGLNGVTVVRLLLSCVELSRSL